MAILQMTVNVQDIEKYQFFNNACNMKGNYIVDWGDGCIEVNSEDHLYGKEGVYQITVKGGFTIRWLSCAFNVISLDKEEGCGIVSLEFGFYSCRELISVPQNWDLSKVEEMDSMFYYCSSFNQDLSHWDLPNLDVIRDMFWGCPIKEEYKPSSINIIDNNK